MSKKVTVNYKIQKSDNYKNLSDIFGTSLLAQANIFGDEDLEGLTKITINTDKDSADIIYNKLGKRQKNLQKTVDKLHYKKHKEWYDKEAFFLGTKASNENIREVHKAALKEEKDRKDHNAARDLLHTTKQLILELKKSLLSTDPGHNSEKYELIYKSILDAYKQLNIADSYLGEQTNILPTNFDRYHTGRLNVMDNFNKDGIMYKGVTLNGNEGRSYADSKRNLQDQILLGLDLQNTLKDAAKLYTFGTVGPVGVKNISGFVWDTTKSMITNPLKTIGTMLGSSIADNMLEPHIENKYIRSAISGAVGGGLGATIGNRATQGMARFLIGNIQNNKLGLPSIVLTLGSLRAKDAYVKAADTFLNKTQLGRALVKSDALAITPTVLNPTTISGKIGNQIIRYNPHFTQNAVTLGILSPVMVKADEIVEGVAPGVTGTLPYEFIKTGLMNKAGKTAGIITSQKTKQTSKGLSNLVEVGESFGKPGPPFTGTRLMDTNKGKLNHEPINTNKTKVMDNTYADNTNIKRGYAFEEGGISDPTITALGHFIVGLELPKINPDKISLTELGRLISASRGSKHALGVLLRSSQTNWGLQNLENSGLTARDLSDSEITYVNKGKTSKSTNMKLVDNDGRLNIRRLRSSDNHDNDFISQDLSNGRYAVVNAAGHLVQQLNLPKGKTYQYKDSDGAIKNTNKIQIATDDPGYSKTLSKYNGAGARIMGLLGFSGGQFLDMNSDMRNTVAIQPLRIASIQKPVQKVPEIPKGSWGILYPMMVAKTAKGYPELQLKGMNVSKKGISKANYNKLPNSARQYFKLVNQNGKNKYVYDLDNNAPNYSTPRWIWEGIKHSFQNTTK